MASFNQVVLLGNLTRDPQTRHLPSGGQACEFGLATNRKYKTADGEDREDVCFVDCTAFGRQAEVIDQYCQKGKQLLVQGRLRYDTWEDKNGGGKRHKLSVVVENFQLMGGGRDAEGGGGAPFDREPAPRRGPADEPRRPAPQQQGNRPPARPAGNGRGGSGPSGQGRSAQRQGRQSPADGYDPDGDMGNVRDQDIPF